MHRSRSPSADPADFAELIDRCVSDIPDCSEPVDEGARVRDRYAGDRAEHCYPNRIPTPNWSPIWSLDLDSFVCVSRTRDRSDPSCGIDRVGRADHRDCSVAECHEHSSDPVGGHWARIDVAPLHEDDWERRRRAEPVDLSPEPSGNDTRVEISDRLALDPRVRADGVIAGTKRPLPNHDAERTKRRWHPTPHLPVVDQDATGWSCDHSGDDG